MLIYQIICSIVLDTFITTDSSKLHKVFNRLISSAVNI